YGLPGSAEVRANHPLTGLGSKTTPERLTAYLLNPLAVDPSGRMPDMVLQPQEATDLARTLCQAKEPGLDAELPAAPAKEKVLAAFGRLETGEAERRAFQALGADEQLRDLGKRLVSARGCVNCHTVAPGGKALAATDASSLEEIKNPQ